MPKVNINDKYSPDDVERALALLEKENKQKSREAEKRKDPEYRKRQKERNSRQGARQRILLSKAVTAGITVTEEEIEAYVKSKSRK